MAAPTLPAPPRALASILEAASNADVRLDHLTRLVSRDPVFAGTILKAANTARHRGSRREPITDLQQATVRMGVRTLRNYALCHTARSCASVRLLGDFDIGAFWENSARRAVAAELLAEHSSRVDPQEAFTIGLLMELGVVALMMEHPEHASAWSRVQHAESSVRLKREQELFGATHTDVNRTLASDWSLPSELAVPLMHHHNPQEAPKAHRFATRLAATAEILAGVLSSDDTRTMLERARESIRNLLDCNEDQADAILDSLGERVQAAAELLGIAVGRQPSLEDILQAANRSLVEANLSYEDLVRRLEDVIAEKEALAQELDQRNRELQRLSTTDALTELPNRNRASCSAVWPKNSVASVGTGAPSPWSWPTSTTSNGSTTRGATYLGTPCSRRWPKPYIPPYEASTS